MSASDAQFEEAKALLAQKAGVDSSIFEHLSETLLKVIVEAPSDSYKIFESISQQARDEHDAKVSSYDASRGDGFKEYAPDGPKSGGWKAPAGMGNAYADATGALFKVPTEEEPDPEPVETQDLPAEAHLLQWAGVGFGVTETYRLHISMEKHAANMAVREENPQTISKLRLWGKIHGTQSDYYVAEGLTDAAEEDEDAARRGDPGGSPGVNEYTYWVCKFAGDAWVQLPNVTGAQIVAARALRKFLTGNLDAPVLGYPPFPGTEKNLLRAQIARITSAAIATPKGIYQRGEDENQQTMEPVEDEEAAPLSAKELLDISNWQHMRLHLNDLGRSTLMPEEEPEGGGDFERGPSDVIKPSICELGEDADADTAWRVRAAEGDLVAVSSLVWPGALTIGSGKQFASVYVGYALKYQSANFTPQAPKQLQAEYDLDADVWAPWGEGEDVVEQVEAEEEEGEED
jgi:radial spoke head protein 4A